MPSMVEEEKRSLSESGATVSRARAIAPESEESVPPKSSLVSIKYHPETPSSTSDIWAETLPDHPSMIDSDSGHSESLPDEPQLTDGSFPVFSDLTVDDNRKGSLHGIGHDQKLSGRGSHETTALESPDDQPPQLPLRARLHLPSDAPRRTGNNLKDCSTLS